MLQPDSFWGVPWNKLFDLNVIKKNHITFPFDIYYCEDEVFVLSYLMNVEKVCYIEQRLYNYMVNPTSVNHKIETYKVFDARCMTRIKADDINQQRIESFNDSELLKHFLARRFRSDMATMQKLLVSNLSVEEKEYYSKVKRMLRSHYWAYLTCKSQHIGIKEKILQSMFVLSPRLGHIIDVMKKVLKLKLGMSNP